MFLFGIVKVENFSKFDKFFLRLNYMKMKVGSLKNFCPKKNFNLSQTLW